MKPVRVIYVALIFAVTLAQAQIVATSANQANKSTVGERYPSNTFLNATETPREAVSKARSRLRKVSPQQTQTGPEEVLYAFKGTSDGWWPLGALIFDSKGSLYGTTEFGGSNGMGCGSYWPCGAVFELSPNSSRGWTETILYSFQGSSDGGQPVAGLVFDQSGNLYGTAQIGGNHNYGTVFELSASGSGGWTETTLYAFAPYTGDGWHPSGGLIFDKAGNLYGTTSYGGAGQCNGGCGAVFELSPNGSGGWTESVLYSFTGGTDGQSPNASLVFDQSGNLYGTTTYGGNVNCFDEFGKPIGCGAVFELSPNGSGGWTESTLYSFQGGNDGGNSFATLVLDQSGNLYGTTMTGAGGYGVVFELAHKAGSWTEITLHAFNGDGYGPTAGLVFDQSGNLYGTTANGNGVGHCLYGNYPNCGTVFELSPNGSGGWTETVLYDFQGTPTPGVHPATAMGLWAE